MQVEDFKNIYPKLIDGYYFVNKNNITNTDLIDHEDEIIVYCGYGGEYINPNIKLNLFFKSYINNGLKFRRLFWKKKYISIQFRNTDKNNDYNLIIKKINQHSKKLKRNNIKKIFLATDDSKSLDIFKKLLPDFEIFSVCDVDYFKGKCIHYNTKDKNKLTIDLLKDIYMILKSKYFIPSINSGVSRWIIQMLEEKNNIFDIESDTQVWNL